MRVLGPARIVSEQQRELADGKTIFINASAVYPDAAKRARIGDWWWVREPYVEFKPKRFQCPSTLHSFAPGTIPLHITYPPRVLPWSDRMHLIQHWGEDMRRSESRVSLEITALLTPPAEGWECRVHMQPIDQILHGRAT